MGYLTVSCVREEGIDKSPLRGREFELEGRVFPVEYTCFIFRYQRV